MKAYKIIFSPTGGTEKVADAIAQTWDIERTIDLTCSMENQTALEKDAIAIIAMPSFGGTAPQIALDRLAKISADHTKCVIVAVYGNRAYEDTLIQMKDYAEKAGFQVIAAVSAVAEHSILREIASGRPNDADIAELHDCGERIMEKAIQGEGSINVPGNHPYKKAGKGLTPAGGKACTSCGLCVKKCPVQAIDPSNPKKTDSSKCIGCMRCVEICPQKARNVNPIMRKAVALAIQKACAEPKKIELFL